MTMKIILAATLSLGLGSTALAQTNTTATTDQNASVGGIGSMPMEWQGAIGDAFYSDTAAGTLRSQSEVESNWADLSSEQQAQVREHCATVETASAMDDAGTTAGSDVTAGANTTTGTDTTAGSDLTAGANATTGTDTTAGSDVTAGANATTGSDTTAGADVTAGADTGATDADTTTTASTDMNSMAQLCGWIDDI